jgi:hypothetical protein
MSAGIGCLVIFGIFSIEQGLDYSFKALAAIVLLGVASAAISLVTGNGGAAEDETEQ